MQVIFLYGSSQVEEIFMRSLIICALLVVALIIGILTIKDMKTEDQTHTQNIERVDQAKKAAEQAQQTLNHIKDTAKQAAQSKPSE
jgi:hypothetical protein